MADRPRLSHPLLVAVWPGMGHVALNAGVYLLAKLGMHVLAEIDTEDVFDVEHVEVKEGLIQPGRRPRNRFFGRKDPEGKQDLIVFLGEVQPPVGKDRFCRQLLAWAEEAGVERVFTFAAMATDMHPARSSRVFGAAIDRESLAELRRLELEILEGGHISGLNGILLGAAAEKGLRGACLLGEMPHVLSQIPYPKASRAVLRIFTTLVGIPLDFTELDEQVRSVDQQIGQVMAQEGGQEEPTAEEEEYDNPEPAEEDPLLSVERRRIEGLFEQAGKDRAKAFELKQELDRLGLFKEYEDRFLDLFRKAG